MVNSEESVIFEPMNKTYHLVTVAALIAAFFVGCKEPVWTKKDKEEFKTNCVNKHSERLTYEEGLAFCECALDYVTSTYNNPEEARNLTKKDNDVITGRCFKKD
jgi:hypothetical protein